MLLMHKKMPYGTVQKPLIIIWVKGPTRLHHMKRFPALTATRKGERIFHVIFLFLFVLQ